MRTSRVAALLAVGALASAASVAFAQESPGSGTIGIQLLEAPSDRANDPRARTYVIDHVKPGSMVSRTIALSNSTARSVSVVTYASAAEITDGSFVGASDRTSNELSQWSRISPAQTSIPAGGEVKGEVSIRIPSDASPGERYAVAWVEVGSAAGAGGVQQVNRVGIRIYLSVGAGGEPASDFAVDSMTAARNSDGLPFVRATVRNTGGRALDMSGTLRLADGPGGLSAGPFPAELGTTLGVGQTGPVSIVLDEALPKGPWTARLELESGLLKRAVDGVITFPDQGEAAPVDAELVDDSGPPWLWIVLGGGLLLALALLLLFLLKRRGRRDDDEKQTSVLVAPPA